MDNAVYGRRSPDEGAVPFWDGSKLCAGLHGARAHLFEILWREGLIRELVESALLAPVALRRSSDPRYDVILDLDVPRRISYCYEWSGEMWKDAAVHVFRLLSTLAQIGLTLKWPRPWHVQFSGPRPIYIHPGTIAPLTHDAAHQAVGVVVRSLVRPAAMSGTGRGSLARALLRNASSSMDFDDGTAADLMSWIEANRERPPAALLTDICRQLERVNAASPPSRWCHYYDGAPGLPRDPERWSAKQQLVHRVLAELAPASVLDVGCNTGWYSRLAHAVADDVIALDVDDACVDELFRHGRTASPRLLPLVMDLSDPSPALGAGGWFAPADQRLAAEMVLALAVSHHLVFSGARLAFEELIGSLSRFAQRWLLLEFVPFGAADAPYRPEDRVGSLAWYGREHLLATLEAAFRQVSLVSILPTGREVFLCER